MMPSRRRFVSALGAASALCLSPQLPLAAAASSPGATPGPGVPVSRSREDLTLEPGLVYLQTGSLGPSPRPVVEASLAAWRELERNPAFVGYGAQEHHLEEVRATAASFIGCETDELVLTTSTTTGMNWVAQGLTFAAGDRVLTTDQEHPGGRACWDYVARRHGVVLDVVPMPPGLTDPGEVVRRVAAGFTPRTRVLSFSHVLSSNGLRMPAAELSALARAHGCLAIVDGAQAVGSLVVDVHAMGCHAYATSGHKWLLAPKGTGLLYLSRDLGRTVDPIALEGGRAAYSNSSGVCSLPSVHGLGAALRYLSAVGMPRIEAHNLALRARLYDALAAVPQLRAVGPREGPLASAMLAYELPSHLKAGDLQARLRARRRIEVKLVPSQWFNGHRISTHLFNTEADVDALVTALRTELA